VPPGGNSVRRFVWVGCGLFWKMLERLAGWKVLSAIFPCLKGANEGWFLFLASTAGRFGGGWRGFGSGGFGFGREVEIASATVAQVYVASVRKVCPSS